MNYEFPIRAENDVHTIGVVKALQPAVNNYSNWLAKNSLLNAFKASHVQFIQREELSDKLKDLAIKVSIPVPDELKSKNNYSLEEAKYMHYLESVGEADLKVIFDTAWESVSWWTRQSPDYSHWALMPSWTLEEAALLVMGFNPERVTVKLVSEYAQYVKELQEVERFLNLIKRVFNRNAGDMVDRATFVNWCVDNRQALPDELAHESEANRKKLLEALKFSVDGRQSLLEKYQQLLKQNQIALDAIEIAKNRILELEGQSKQTPVATLAESERTKFLKLIACLSVLYAAEKHDHKKYFLKRGVNKAVIFEDIDYLVGGSTAGWRQVNLSNVSAMLKEAMDTFPEIQKECLGLLHQRKVELKPESEQSKK